MIRTCFLSLLFTCLAYGQVVAPSDLSGNTTTQAGPASPAEENIETKVAPDDPVITINNFCPSQTQPDHVCETAITRAQFEKLTEALQPGMSMPLRLKVANVYARNLRMSAEAEKRGLDKTPSFQQAIQFARMQLLSQDLNRELQQQANTVADGDVTDYYKQHESDYVEATFARIFVPHARQSQRARDPMGTDQQTLRIETKLDVDTMTKAAAELRERAANGEDPDKLQIEAYREAGIQRATVNTRIDNARRTMLPPQHESVMELNPGEVSQVFSDPEGAHFIYKMLKKETLTLDVAKMEIRKEIAKQKYRDSIKDFEGNVVFSDAYFNPPKKSSGR